MGFTHGCSGEEGWRSADFRKINKLTVKEPYHIPLVQEIVGRVGNAKVLSKLDLSKGFYQVKMADADRQKTAVVTQFGKLEEDAIWAG